MNKRESKDDSWDPCHPGTIFDTAATRPAGNSLMVAAVVVIGLTVGTVLSVKLAIFAPTEGMPRYPHTPVTVDFSAVNCVSVNAELVSFVSGEIADAKHKKRIAVHILNCPSCRRRYKAICCNGSEVCPGRPQNATLKPQFVQSPNP